MTFLPTTRHLPPTKKYLPFLLVGGTGGRQTNSNSRNMDKRTQKEKEILYEIVTRIEEAEACLNMARLTALRLGLPDLAMSVSSAASAVRAAHSFSKTFAPVDGATASGRRTVPESGSTAGAPTVKNAPSDNRK